MWERRLVCNTEEEADPHIALTKTCLYAVARLASHSVKIFHLFTAALGRGGGLE